MTGLSFNGRNRNTAIEAYNSMIEDPNFSTFIANNPSQISNFVRYRFNEGVAEYEPERRYGLKINMSVVKVTGDEITIKLTRV